MASQVFVIKDTEHAKTSCLLRDPDDISDALDPQFFVTLVRRWKKNFDSNAGADWRAPAAEDQYSVNRNVVREASLGVFRAVIPMEDDREPKPISNGCSTLHLVFLP